MKYRIDFNSSSDDTQVSIRRCYIDGRYCKQTYRKGAHNGYLLAKDPLAINKLSHFLLCYMTRMIVRYLEWLMKKAGKPGALDSITDTLTWTKAEKSSFDFLGGLFAFDRLTHLQRDLFGVCGLPVPGNHQSGPAVRTLLGLKPRAVDYFLPDEQKPP